MNDEEKEKAVVQMFTAFAEECEGENLVATFAAIERLIVHLITNNCVNAPAAHEVADTLYDNIRMMVESFDALGLCVWNEKETLN
jgi:DNA invertase Pin-like site-specific DNA recombinase